jgi:hypothetical protein
MTTCVSMTRSKIAGRRRQPSWAGSNLTRDVAEIESVNSDGSDPTPKQGLKGKTFVKKMKSAVGAISGRGSSRAAAASRELRRKVQSGEFKPGPQKLQKWTAEIKRIDTSAEVNDKTAKDVRHSTCGRWYKVKNPYDTYFRKQNAHCYRIVLPLAFQPFRNGNKNSILTSTNQKIQNPHAVDGALV